MARVRVADGFRLVVAWAWGTAALAVTTWLLPGLSVSSWQPLVVAAAATGVVGALVRPVLAGLAASVGWLAVALVAVAGQAVAMQVALSLVPGVEVSSFWTTLAAAWISAVVGTAFAWLSSAGTDDSFATAVRRRAKPAGSLPDPDVDGVVFVQFDGVSYPVLRWALSSGSMPTLRRWVDAGSHTLHEWLVQMPCTTPASQQAILQGSADGVPAFRWYDRALGRVVVANRPADAALIERRASTGRGLLADDGCSVSNLFTGDAPRASMTMSRVELTRGSRSTRATFARFMVRPDGLARSLARTVAEVARERFQASRQRRLAVHPRVARSWTFAGLRAFSNGILRDLNTVVVAEEMAAGRRSVYVDYVDYDEVAHHAGGSRLESLAALTALDQVLALLEKVAASAPRRYHFVVLSDHGQSQGAPFSERWGTDLAGLCADLAAAPVTGVQKNVEDWGRVGLLVDDLAGKRGDGGVPAGMAGSVSRRVDRHLDPGHDGEQDTGFVVLGSGNLGLVSVPGPERLSIEELDARWPALVPGLAAHPGIGFVAGMAADGPVAVGADGVHHLATGQVRGTDPLAPFGEHAPAMLLHAVSMPEAPDLYVNSAVDPVTLEVAAFEDLVGCHGGLGGWQDRGFLLAPADLLHPDAPIVGGDRLHAHLVALLETLGHRTDLPRRTPDPRRTP